MGNPTKLFIFTQDEKSHFNNNYLQDTQQNIYFFEWRGNAHWALASNIYFMSEMAVIN